MALQAADFPARSAWWIRSGAAGRPRVVLLHGAAATRWMWGPQLRGLAGDFDLLAPDLPGHGLRADVPFSIDRAVEDVSSLINEECQGRAAVVGLSLGGVVGLQLARRNPDIVSALIMSGSSVDYSRLHLRAIGYLNYLLLGRIYRERWLEQLNATTLRRRFPAEIAEEQIEAGFYYRGAAPAFRELGRIDYFGSMAEYTGPVLILNGETDWINRRFEQAFRQAGRDVSVEVLLGAGHACNLEAPEAFNDAVRRFLFAHMIA